MRRPSSRGRLPAALLALALAGCASGPPALPPPPPVVALLSDFGTRDDAVGLMRGVILTLCPRATLVDLTHEVARFDVDEGARLLADAPGFFPPGAVFCVVVDPGVGTKRRPIVARFPQGVTVVAPDNGVISRAAERHGPVEVRALENPTFFLPEVSATFHGRDVFAPAAAHLAAGRRFETVGPVVDDWIRLEEEPPRRDGIELVGRVVAIDEPFGNVWTDLPPDWLLELRVERGDRVQVVLGGTTLSVPFVGTFGDVPVGDPLLYVNSRGRLALALNQGDFALQHRVERGQPLRIRAGE